MNFKYKSAIQSFYSNIPVVGENINYFFQRYICKSLPIKDIDFNYLYNEKIGRHYKNFMDYNKTGKSADQCNYYEFGAGWDLLAPIGFSNLGFKSLSVIDIQDHVRYNEIKNTIRLFEEYILDDKSQLLHKKIKKRNFKEFLYDNFRIKYYAPLDAKNTKFDSESFDLIVSNVTFEHIPSKFVLPILNECYRLLTKGGTMSIIIDYQDHYAYFDDSISIYNYLIYSEKQWRRYNNPAHYQNRLRHCDYVDAIKTAGFEIVHTNLLMPDEKLIQQFNSLKIDDCFSKYSKDDLKIRCSELVIVKGDKKI